MGFRARLGQLAQSMGGIVNFPAKIGAGIKQYCRLILVEGNKLGVGVEAKQSPFAVTSQQGPGVEVVQTTINLTNASWVNSASESAGSDWNNVAELEGADDGVTATLEEGLVLTQGTLIGDFPAQVNRGPLVINSVKLVCYYRVGNFLLIGTTLTVRYRVGALGLPVQLDQHVGGVVAPTDVNRLDGFEFDITSSGPSGTGDAWTWDDLSDLRIEYDGTILVDTGLSIVEADATQLIITASHTEAA